MSEREEKIWSEKRYIIETVLSKGSLYYGKESFSLKNNSDPWIMFYRIEECGYRTKRAMLRKAEQMENGQYEIKRLCVTLTYHLNESGCTRPYKMEREYI